MPNEIKRIKSKPTKLTGPNAARQQVPLNREQDSKPSKKAGDGAMTFMVWSIAGTVIAACSSPIFSDVADLAGGGGSSGDTQSGPDVGALTNGRISGADISVVENGVSGADVGHSDEAGNIILDDGEDLVIGAQYDADLNVFGAREISTNSPVSGTLRSLPYSGGDLVISPLTDLLAKALNDATAQEVEDAGGDDGYYQGVLDSIYGESIVTVDDVLDRYHYNPLVTDDAVTQLVSRGATALNVIQAQDSTASNASRIDTLRALFSGYRDNIADGDATNDAMVVLSDSGLIDEGVNTRVADAIARGGLPVVATPNGGEAISMTEDQDSPLVSGNAELLFGFQDPFGNSDSPDDEDDAIEDGQLVGIYIQAASVDGNVNVMFRDNDRGIVGLASVQGADRGVVTSTPAPYENTFFYVSAENFGQLILRPDANFNTENNPNPQIRFYVYDGEDVTPETGIGMLGIEVAAENDAPEITSQTTPAPITSNTGSASGTFQVSDADDGDTVFTWVATATGPTTYGTLEFADTNGTDMSGNGAWTFTLNQSAFDEIAAGENVPVTFNITADDGNGGVSAPVSVVIMLQGQGDVLPPTASAPVLGEVTSPPAVKTATEAGHELDNGVTVAAQGIAARGSFTHTDANAGQGDFVGGTVHIKAASALDSAYADGLGNNAGNNIIDGTDRGTAVIGTYGTIYLRADGDWYYVLDDARTDINALPGGASTLIDVFNVRIQETADSTMVSNVLDLTIAITGKDDAPTDIQATLAGGSEDALVATYNGNEPTAGMLVASLTTTDPDSTAHTYMIDTSSTDESSFQIGGANNDQLLFASSGAVNKNPGETWVVGVISTDSDGLSRTEPFTVTRAGNAFPVFSASITNYDPANSLITAEVNDPLRTQSEDAPTATGTLIATDFGTADADIRYSAVRHQDETNNYGSLSVDPNTGDWTFTLTTSAEVTDGADGVTVLNALASATATATMDFTVTADDGAGGTATATLTVTLRGAPDSTVTRPTIDTTNSDLEDTITDADARNHEDIPSAVSGNIALTAGDTDGLMWSVAAASVSGRPADVPDGTDFGTLTFPNSPSFTSFGTAFSGTSPLGWTFTPTDEINLLDDSETVVLTYSITATNRGGASMMQTLTINLEGMTNAVPLIDSTSISDTQMVPDTDAAPDNTFATLTGTFTAGTSTVTKWSHAAQASSVSVNTYGTDFGEFSFDNAADEDGDGLDRGESRDGAWRFIPNADLINRIPHGETVTFAYRITATNDAGASMAGGQDFMFSFTGINDKPVLAVTGNNAEVTEAGGANNAVAGTDPVTGGFTITDPDVHSGANQDSLLFGGNMLQGRSGSTGAYETDGSIDGTYGTLTLEGDGTWTYTLDNTDTATQALRGARGSTAAQTVQDVFQIQLVNEDAGNTQTSNVETLTIEVTGANDDPVITDTSGVIFNVVVDDPTDSSADVPPAVNQGSNNPATSSAYGSFAATDVDAGDTIAWSMTGASINASMTEDAFDGRTAADFGALTVNADGTWSFAPTDAINGLDTNQSVVIDYTIQADDGNGGTGTSILRVTLNGTTNLVPNNDPEITEAASGVIFNVVVDDPTDSSTDTPPAVDQSSTNPATSSAYGNFIATDADTGDTIAWSMTGASINASMTEDAFDGRTAADFGALTVNADGTWSFAPTDAINGLDTNQSVVIDYTIQASDGNSGIDTSILRVTLNGTTNLVPNNDPEITEATSGVIFNVVVDDPTDSSTDTPPAVDQSSTNPATSSAYGNFIATDADTGDTIAWSMTGASINASMTEDAFDGRTAADFGALTVNADGTWSFAPTDAINGLDTNQSVVIDYTIQASDGNSGIDTSILRVTLNGRTNLVPNNDPEITEATSGVIFNVVVDDPTDSSTDTPPAVDQSSTNPATSSAYGNFIATDADTGDTIAWSMTGASINASMTEDAFDGRTAADFGALTVNADGTWSFAPTDAINGLDTNQSVVIDYTIQASDGNSGIDTSILRVTLNGTTTVIPNNDPEITEATSGVIFNVVVDDPTDSSTDTPPAVDQSSTNPATSSAYGNFIATDADTGDTIAWSMTGASINASMTEDAFDGRTAADFGALTVNADGTWSFAPTDAINGLDTNQSVVIDYTIQASDGNGGIDTSILRVTLNGTTNVIPITTEIPEVVSPTNGYYHLPATGQAKFEQAGVTYSVNGEVTPDTMANRGTTYTASTASTNFRVEIDENGIWSALPTAMFTSFPDDGGTTAERDFYIHAHDAGNSYLGSRLITAKFNEMTIVSGGADGSSGPINEVFIGTTGNDNFATNAGTDVIVALEGNDTIKLGRNHSDTIYHRFSSSGTDWTNTDGGDTFTNYNRSGLDTFIFVDTDSSVVTEDNFLASDNIQLWATFIQGTVNGLPGAVIREFEIRFVDPDTNALESTITFEYNSTARPGAGTLTAINADFVGTGSLQGSIFNTAHEITDHRVWGNYFGTTADSFQVIDDNDLPPAIASIANLPTAAPNNNPEITEATSGVIFNVVVDDPTDSSTDTPPAVNQGSNNPATSSAYGSFAATDADTGDTITWSQTGVSINAGMTTSAFGSRTPSDFGALTVDGAGTWSFAPTDDINELNTGESVVIDYTIQADDGAGGTDTSILRVTLNGETNAGGLVVTNEAVRAFVIVKGVEFRVNTDSRTTPPSSYELIVNDSSGEGISPLGAGGDFAVFALTGNNHRLPANIARIFDAARLTTVGTITNVDIAAIILEEDTTVFGKPESHSFSSVNTTLDVDVTEDDAADSTARGFLQVTDATDADTYTYTGGTTTEIGTGTNAVTYEIFNGIYGQLIVDGDGNWTYVLNNADDDTQRLEDRQTGTDDFDVLVTQTAGSGTGAVTAMIRIRVNGANDAVANRDPMIDTTTGIFSTGITITDDDTAGNNDPGPVNQATVPMGGAAYGSFTATDPDGNDNAITWTPASSPQPGSMVATGSINVSNAGSLNRTYTASEFGALTVQTDGTWSFDPTAAINDIIGNEYVVLSYDIVATDSGGGTDTETLTVRLNGSDNDIPNRAPTLTPSAAPPAGGYVIREAPSINSGTIDGTLTIDDPDTTDTPASLTVIGVINDGGTNTLNTQPDSGMISSNDDIHTITGSNQRLAGVYGDFVLMRDDTNGAIAWEYEIDNERPATNALPQYVAGDSTTFGTETLSLRVWDDEGLASADTRTISVEVRGQNDATMITSLPSDFGPIDVMDSSTNDGDDPTASPGRVYTGTFSATDPDAGSTITWLATATGANSGLGTVTFDNTNDMNEWVFRLTPAGVIALNNLAAVDTTNITFTITANGVSAPTPLTIRLMGAADGAIAAPVIDTNSVTIGTVTDGDARDHRNIPTSASGTITATSDNNITWNSSNMMIDGFTGRAASEFGGLTLTPNANGTSVTWEFTPTDAINDLSDGDVGVTITYTITATAGGDPATTTLTINLAGVTNAAPQITAGNQFDPQMITDMVDDPTNEPAAISGAFTATGTVTGWSSTMASFTGDIPAGRTAAEFGSFTLNDNGEWTFDPTDAINDLGMGQSVIIEYTITADNAAGSSTSETFRITLAGTNDVPTITSTGGGQILTDASADDHILDPSAPQTIRGTAVASDVDANDGDGANGADDFTWSIADGVATKTYGTLVFDNSGVGGGWTFTTDPAAFNELTHGQRVPITYSVQAEDPQSATSAAMDLTITLEGVNDKPDLAVNTIDGAVTEAGDTAANGSLTITDPDTGHNDFTFAGNTLQGRAGTSGAYETDGSIDGIYGTLTLNDSTGAWTYALDDGDSDTQGLRAAQTAQDVFQIQLVNVDGTGQGRMQTSDVETLTINVTGANDDPVIVTDTGIFSTGITITDDNPIPTNDPDAVNQATVPMGGTAYGSFTANDVDTGDTITWSPAMAAQPGAPATGRIDVSNAGTLTNSGTRTAAQFGALTVSADGTWSFDPTTAINDIADTEYVVLSYDIVATDSSGGTDMETLTVRLNGVTNVLPPAPAPDFSGASESTHTFVDPDAAPDNDPARVDRSILVTNPDQLMWSVAAPVVTGDTSEDAAHFGAITFPSSLFASFGTAFARNSLNWAFDPNTGINDLNDGQSVTITYTVTATNRGGASSNIDLVITLEGLTNVIPNSAPTLTPSAAAPAGGYFVVEDSSTSMVNSTLMVDDPDLTDTIGSLTVIGVINDQANTLNTQPNSGMISSNDDIYAITGALDQRLAGLYGDFVLTRNPTGAIDWRYEIVEARANSLDETETPTETLSVRVWDDDGLASANTETISVEVRGADDPLAFDANNDFDAVVVDPSTNAGDTPTATGTFSATDPDDPTITWMATATGANSGLGTVTFVNNAWTFTLTDPAGVNALNALGSGATTDITFNITANGEDAGNDLTITLTGAATEVTGLFAVPTALAGMTTAGRDMIEGTANAETIQGGDDNDVINTVGGNDLVIGGYGGDTINLASGAETIVYRFESEANDRDQWQASDGGDTINNFEFGKDKLILVDVSGDGDPINDLTEFTGNLSGEVGLEITPNFTAFTADQLVIAFTLLGTVNGPAGGAEVGNRLTINFAPGGTSFIGDGLPVPVSALGGGAFNLIVDPSVLDEFFGGADFFQVVDEMALPTELTIL